MQRLSKLFTKTSKLSKEYDSKNATLLIKAGYIHQVMAGTYTLLPLGLRVYRKIEKVIREEMDKVSQELLMTSLSPMEPWEITGRLDTVDILMKTSGANELSKKKNTSEYILNCTHEDQITPIAQKFNLSYKEFPFSVYQIQSKFRNEARPKSGIMRGREFIMKDAYSFHVSEEDLLEYYEVMKNSYMKIYERLGLGDITLVALASGGDFTDKYSHEFQTICETGEDLLFRDNKAGLVYNREVTPAVAPQIDNKSEELKEMEEVEGKGIIGVEALAEYLKIPVEKTTKTILFEDEKGEVIAAGVRGGRDIDEGKLKKVAKVKELKLASEDTVKRVTGAQIGYAGILNLPKEVRIFMDESMQGRSNFEMGANKTDYHTININFGRDLSEPEEFFDIKVAQPGDLNSETGEVYEVLRASEVGNIFPLNTKFSDAFGYKYTDQNGSKKSVYMGSYGIGLTRIMGVIAEIFNDEKGLVWPKEVAPFDIHFITLGEEHNDQAKVTIDLLENAGYDVLWDDRSEVSAGEKFGDAELIGIPIQIILSKRSLENGGLEINFRKNKENNGIVEMENLIAKITSLV